MTSDRDVIVVFCGSILTLVNMKMKNEKTVLLSGYISH